MVDDDSPYLEEEAGELDEARRRADLRRELLRAGIREMFSHPNARAYVWRIFESCHLFETTWDPDSSVAAFREGRRAVGLMILSDLMAVDPTLYTTMQQEAKRNPS